MSGNHRLSASCAYSIKAMEANSIDDSVLTAKKIDVNQYREMLNSIIDSLASSKEFVDSTLNSVNAALAETASERYYSGGKAVQNRNNLCSVLESIEDAEKVVKNLTSAGIEAKVAEYNEKLPKLKRAAILNKLIEQAQRINAAKKPVPSESGRYERRNLSSTNSFRTYDKFIYMKIHSFTPKYYDPAAGEQVYSENIDAYEHINYDDCIKDKLNVQDSDIAKLENRITQLGYTVAFDKSRVVYD